MNFPDPLKNYISDVFFRRLIYAFGLLFIIIPTIILIGLPIIFVLGVMVLSYKKISDERIKWGVITVLTITLLITSTYKSPKETTKVAVEQKNESLNSNSLAQNQVQDKESIPSIEIKTAQSESQFLNLNDAQGFSEVGTKNSTMNSIQNPELFLVTKVIDGDTIEIEGGKRVRYIGIDTPETVHPSKPVECYGKEASNKNIELVLDKKVSLVKDVSETDKYGRLLRYVYVGDVFVNDYLVKEGYAKASTYPPDVKFNEQFLTSQKYAIDNDKGLWGSTCDISTPSKIPTTQVVTQNLALKVTSNTEKESDSSNSSSDVVKKSSTGICHAPGSTYYSRTKNFTPYDSIEDCLDSGGRLPKR
jgi:micrococcal nuclease